MQIITIFVLLLNNYSSISGFVTDASNGEQLAYANVYLENTALGSATNEKGYYIIHNVPEGSHKIVFSYISYQTITREIEVNAGQNLTLNVELHPSIIEMERIVVSAERTRFEEEVEISRVNFTRREIKAIPSLLEKDLIKTLQLMPGVISMHDLSNKLYIRGGSPDENLALLDGITVYNPSSHLFGLFSTFDPDVVSNAELFAGGFPASYGDRLSSVLSITTKEGNSKKFAGEATIGLITSKLVIEGPLPKGSFLISGRRTYFDALVWAYSKIKNDTLSLPYYFYDGIAKINFNPSPENRFTLAALGGSDVLQFEENFEGGVADEKIELDWGNRGVSLRWRRVFNPKLYGEMVGAWSNFLTTFSYENYDDSTNNFAIHEEIIDYTGKIDFNYFLNDHHTFDIGIDAKQLKIMYNLDLSNLEIAEHSYKPQILTAYVQDKWSLIPNVLSVQGGLRSTYYSINDRFCFDPRLGLKYHIGPNTAFNLAWGKYSQFLITINSQESYFSIFDFWRPVDSMHTVPTAYHVIAGIEKWFDDDTKLTIEPYYKKYFNLLIPREYGMYFSQPSESLKVSSGYSFGIDFFFKKSFRDIFGWISYSLGYTRRKQFDRYYAPRYDRRHNLNIVLGYKIPQSVPILNKGTFNLRWYLASGLPYAEDLARYRVYYYDAEDNRYHWDWFTIKGPRDAYRLPITHRLDVHLEKDFSIFSLQGSWYIDVMNVYDRENIVFYDLDYDKDPPEKKGYTLLPIPIPSFGINFRF
ncbi:MAG: TonB-dependent receptor [bacterium]